ncbi:MAG TPA: phosphatase PAP2-related protein [Candidatus Paceibacterota bacterium]|nr:phosphatase PAP2-related protein [Candidatus Paceibacterota bacterium]
MAAYKAFFTKERVRSLFVALVLFGLAVVFQFYASAYSERVSSNFVHDLFLDNLPVVNLNLIIVEGALAAIAGSMILLLVKPKYLIFTLKTVAIFIATRAVFVAVTHLGIYPGQINPDTVGFFDRIYAGLGLEAGFFFSGHTGLSFLMALIFWDERLWRWVFLALTVIFGISVLLAHVHYSIDVLAAPYMTYSIFKLSQYFFPEDFKLSQI